MTDSLKSTLGTIIFLSYIIKQFMSNEMAQKFACSRFHQAIIYNSDLLVFFIDFLMW